MVLCIMLFGCVMKMDGVNVNMKKTEILEIVKSLAQSQGFYSNMYHILSSDTPEANAYLTYLEEQNFKDPVDLILFLE